MVLVFPVTPVTALGQEGLYLLIFLTLILGQFFTGPVNSISFPVLSQVDKTY